MRTNFVRVKTDDNLILSGNLYLPDEHTDKAVLHIHGMAGNFYENAFLDFLATTLTAAGWGFLAMNNRGNGIISDMPVVTGKEEYKRIGNAYEKFTDSVFDIKGPIDYLQTFGMKEIVLMGHSLGAVKTAYYAATASDKRVSKLILLSPPDMIALAEDPESKALSDLAKKMIGDDKGKDLLPKLLWDYYYLSAETYLDLNTRGNPIDVFNIYDRSASSVLSKITVPILGVMGGTDNAVTIPVQEALDLIKAKSTGAARFDTAVMGQAPHSYFGYEQQLADTVLNWLK